MPSNSERVLNRTDRTLERKKIQSDTKGEDTQKRQKLQGPKRRLLPSSKSQSAAAEKKVTNWVGLGGGGGWCALQEVSRKGSSVIFPKAKREPREVRLGDPRQNLLKQIKKKKKIDREKMQTASQTGECKTCTQKLNRCWRRKANVVIYSD